MGFDKNIIGKTILVAGLARSGVSAAKLLDELGARVIVSDTKKEEEISEAVEELRRETGCSFCFG